MEKWEKTKNTRSNPKPLIWGANPYAIKPKESPNKPAYQEKQYEIQIQANTLGCQKLPTMPPKI